MEYLKLHFQPGEEIRYRAKIHFALFFEPLCLLMVGGFILWDISSPMVRWLGITVLFLGLVSLVQRVCIKVGSLFVVTNYRVILKTGIFSRRVRELVHTKVEGLTVMQSMWGRVFGYGTLLVTTGGAINTYHFVSDPMRFKREVNSCIETYRSR